MSTHETQQDLPAILAAAEAKLPEDPRNPVYTAERYRRCHPTEYALAVRWCLTDGLPVTAVASALGASRNLISAVVRRESAGDGVAQAKQTAALDYRHLARLTRETLADVVLSLPADLAQLTTDQKVALLRVLPIAAAVATDKAELLSGGPTARVAVVDGAASPAEVVDYLEALQAEVRVRTDLVGGSGGAKGAAVWARVGGSVGGEEGPGEQAHMGDVLLDGEIVPESTDRDGCAVSPADGGMVGEQGGGGVGAPVEPMGESMGGGGGENSGKGGAA